MAEEDPWARFNPQPAPAQAEPAADPWARFNPQPAPEPQNRSILQRAIEAPGESLASSWEGMKKFAPSKERHTGLMGPIHSLTDTGEAILSTVGAIPAAIIAAPASLLASGVSEAARQVTRGDPRRSEEMYEYAKPMAEAALTSVGRVPGITATPKGSVLPDVILPKTKKVPAKGREAEAGRFLEEEAADPAKLRADLAAPDQEIVPGSKPTTHQLTGQLGGQERVAARSPEQADAFRARQAEQNAARRQAFEGIQPTGEPTAVTEHLRTQVRQAEAVDDQLVRVAQQRLWEENQRLGGNLDPTTQGNIFRRELEIAERNYRDTVETPAWNAVDPDRTLRVNPQPLQELERSVYGPQNMSETALTTVTPAEREIAGLIQNYPSNMPFQEMRDLRSAVSTRLREELYTRGQTPAYARMSRLRQGIEEAVNNTFNEAGNFDPAAAERLRAASAATRERVERFRPTRGITRREGVEGPYKLEEPGAIPGKIVKAGPEGYDKAMHYLRAIGPERGLPELQDAVAARYRAEVIKADGSVDPAAHQRWMRKYNETLRAIDERDGGAFSQRLRNVETAQQAVEAAETRRAAIGESEFKKLAGLTDDADIAKSVGNIFGKQDSVGRARALMSRLAGNAEAEEGARRAVVTHMRNTLTGDVLLGDTPNMRAQAFQKYVRNNTEALKQILRPEQIDVLETIARDLLRETRTGQTKAIGGGSDTYQLAQAEKNKQGKLAAAVSRIPMKWLTKRIAAHLAAQLALPGHATAYVVEGAIGAMDLARAAKAKKLAAEMEAIQKLVDEAMLYPEKARALLGKTTRYKDTTPGAKLGAAYEAGAAEEARKRISRQAGGGVPAIGGVGGRPDGALPPLGAGTPRQRSDQAVSYGRAQRLAEGGEAREVPLERSSLRDLPQPSQAEFEQRQWNKSALREGEFDPTARGSVEIRPSHFEYRRLKGDLVLPNKKAAPMPVYRGNYQNMPAGVYAEGGEVEKQPGAREKLGAAISGPLTTGSPAGGGEMTGGKAAFKTKVPPPLSRQDIVDQLRRHGIIDPEVLGGWTEGWPHTADSRYATGGGIDDDTEADLQKPPRLTTSTYAEDPSQDDTDPFADRFGQWGPGRMGRQTGTVPNPEYLNKSRAFDRTIGNRPMVPGERIIGTDPLGISRRVYGMQEGGEVAPMPDSVMDAWSGPAARVRRRAPTREPDPVSLEASMGGRTGFGEYGKHVAEGTLNLAKTPGRVYQEGMTDADMDFGPQMALTAMGGMPFAKPGSLGMAGGRMKVPAAGRTVSRSHNRPPEELEAPFPQYAEQYPPVGPPTMKPKDKPKFEGETYPEKTYTPEAEAFMARRKKVMNEMKKGYTPYFDPAERKDVDPSNYPGPNVDTLTIQPKKEDTYKEYAAKINQPATAKLLRDAYKAGKKLGNAHDWYAMSQLEDAYVKELGEEQGRKAFLDEFAVPMAATTSGNDPRANYLMAHYLEYLRKQGEDIPIGHQFPAPVGGRRVNVNIRDYKAMRDRGGYEGLGEDQPKMHNFARSFIGDLSRGVMDEQMAGGSMAHLRTKAEREEWADKARHLGFGMLERILHQEAARRGLKPGNFQDVAWAGFKGESSGPMINVINDAIERTHRLTGMPREEILRRGVIRKEIPIYGLTAGATPFLWGGLEPGGDDNSSPNPGLPPR